MIEIKNLRLNVGEDEKALNLRAAKILKTDPAQITERKLVKRSLDARKKNDIHYICTAAFSLKGNEKKLIETAKSRDVSEYVEKSYVISEYKGKKRPVIVGFGPAGMFAALVLSYAGARPIVIERGQDAVTRKAAVDKFHAGGELDSENNVQFGEGGAGTFSDGKLNTGTHDHRLSWMLRQFYLHGAKESVLYDAKPHIGTDVLINVVQNIRSDIIEHGGEVRFGTRFERLICKENTVTGIEATDKNGSYIIECDDVILAVGHSARDTFEMLFASGIEMESKGFSMGVRIEHLQSDIDLTQYGRERGKLPAADYSLNVHLPDGTSAYTFCMCPGGYVFAAASEQGGVVTNGMSYSGRGGENANSALLVTLHPEDFPYEGVLGGMVWQREIEQKAFGYGGGNYCAPAQLVGDFMNKRPSVGAGRVKPQYRPGVVWGDLREVLPERIYAVLEKALPELGKKLPGFDNPDAVMTAPETRSSSPVRILRNSALQGSAAGLYPCGVGAGYAGGISSAAVDGMRCAEAVIQKNEELGIRS